MIISSKDAAATLGVSQHKFFKAKRLLGLTKGCPLQTSDMPRLAEVVEKKVKTGGKLNPNFPEYYNKAVGIIEKDGYITKRNLLSVFNTTKLPGVEAYFLKKNNPLYDDDVPVSKKEKRITNNYRSRTMMIFKLCRTQYDIWEKENRINGCFNNGYHGRTAKNI